MYLMYGTNLKKWCDELTAGNYENVSLSGLINMIDYAGCTEELIDAYDDVSSTAQLLEENRMEDVLHFIEEDGSEDGEGFCVAELIAKAIFLKEVLGIYSDSGIVGLTIAVPWFYNKITKALTANTLHEILSRYIKQVFPKADLEFRTFELEG